MKSPLGADLSSSSSEGLDLGPSPLSSWMKSCSESSSEGLDLGPSPLSSSTNSASLDSS